MVGSYTSICRCDASLLIPGIGLCIALVPQDLLGKRLKGSVTLPTKDFPWEDYSYRDCQ
jgi:hypothetical protein